jgi:tRNA (guanine-N7-)-methyltransferase
MDASDERKRPEDYVISRKRKLYKFAKFTEAENCFDLEKWRDFSRKSGKNSRKIVAEIGAGSALFLTKLAAKDPTKTFVAVDRKSDRLWQGAKLAAELGLKNIYYVWADVSRLNQVFREYSVDEIWLTFSDPFAHDDYQEKRAEFSRFYHDKLRFADDEKYAENLAKYLSEIREFDEFSRKNYEKLLRKNGRGRLTNEKFLEQYSRILVAGGKLNFKTDNSPLFEWSLNNFAKNGWITEEISRNLHTETDKKFADAKIMTSYEERFAKEYLPISYAKFSRK